ncbi:MAG: flavodoxin-dependent (E)-4-hydroxy-3-methylbut-2-enyl-diphosphate synthase [Christensenellales bacterium]|jgi:(E)-4-hydroxy-3-methylbut-2-enyl-diphosphate synthase
MRKNTRQVIAGGVKIGGMSRISVQSMTNTDTRDAAATGDQAAALHQAGCDIVRVSVYDMECAKAIPEIKKYCSAALVADVHFDYRLAMASIAAGADKLRINPGNIGGAGKVFEIAAAAKERGIPIRVGANAGSLPRHIMDKYGGLCAEAVVESALEHVIMLEKAGFYDIVISVKASDVRLSLDAYRLLSCKIDYPLHLGITEAGTGSYALIKSAAGIGAMLLDGIGDTLRVSLTGDPVKEAEAGLSILRACGIEKSGVEVISCPTCGRCSISLEPIANAIQKEFANEKRHIKVAVMGCVVNGPGEAREADIGIAGGENCAMLFKRGGVVRKIDEERLLEELILEIRMLLDSRED